MKVRGKAVEAELTGGTVWLTTPDGKRFPIAQAKFEALFEPVTAERGRQKNKEEEE